MTTDLYRQRLIVDGGEAVEDDVNDAQRFVGARVLDQLIASRLPNFANDLEFTGQNGTDAPTGPYAYALSPGGAYMRQGSANNKVQIAPGTLLQKVGAADGLEEKLLAYTFVGTEEFTIGNGDPANPRVDLLQMQLSLVEGDLTSILFDDAVPPATHVINSNQNTTRRVTCALTVKQGVAGATPAYPTPDAGCVVIGAVVVGTNYVAAAGLKFEDTAGAVAVLHDQRMPIRVRSYRVMPRDFIYLAADWTLSTRGHLVTASGTAGPLIVPCPIGDGAGRLVGASAFIFDVIAGISANFGNYKLSNAGIDTSLTHNMNLFDAAIGAVATYRQVFANLHALQEFHTPAAGPAISVNANGMGPPVWSSGRRSPNEVARLGAAPIPFESLCMHFTAAPGNYVVGPVTFFIAEGL